MEITLLFACSSRSDGGVEDDGNRQPSATFMLREIVGGTLHDKTEWKHNFVVQLLLPTTRHNCRLMMITRKEEDGGNDDDSLENPDSISFDCWLQQQYHHSANVNSGSGRHDHHHPHVGYPLGFLIDTGQCPAKC